MPKNQTFDLLPHVQKPSRYLGSEINRIRKDHQQVKLKITLAFPDLYEIGTSHFGIQILYSILNQRKEIAAERFFTPAPDLEALIKRLNESRASTEAFSSCGSPKMLTTSCLSRIFRPRVWSAQ